MLFVWEVQKVDDLAYISPYELVPRRPAVEDYTYIMVGAVVSMMLQLDRGSTTLAFFADAAKNKVTPPGPSPLSAEGEGDWRRHPFFFQHGAKEALGLSTSF